MLKKLKCMARRLWVRPGSTVDTRGMAVLLFIGSPRTGSTLLGQILNYHPQCLIASEENVVARHLVQYVKFEKLLVCIEKNAREAFEHGLEKTDRMDASVYQPRWRSFADLATDPAFKKKDIVVLGDKKAGGTSLTARKHPEKFLRLMKNNPSFNLLQVIRNPITAALSYMKSHTIDSFEDACAHIVETTRDAHRMIQLFRQRSYSVNYEELLQNPEEILTGLLDFLKLQIDADWMEAIVKRINRGTPPEKETYESFLKSAKKIIAAHQAQEAFLYYHDVAPMEDKP